MQTTACVASHGHWARAAEERLLPDQEVCLMVPPHSLHGFSLPTPLAAEELLLPVMNEFAFNLESFNPAFTATLLKVKRG